MTIGPPREWTRAKIAESLGLAPDDLSRKLAAIERIGYDPFVQTKGGKRRVIAAPRPWLKDLQRKAYKRILLTVPISECVHNRPGKGVVLNARKHLGNAYMTVIDVTDCFPSTTVAMVRRALMDMGVVEDAAGALTRLVSDGGCLPQGPPTSPAILDIVFMKLDAAMEHLARSYGAVYTRYMDDLAFSGPVPLVALSREAVRILKSNGYSTNPSKRRVWGPHDTHTVTKIVLNTTTMDPRPEYVAAIVSAIKGIRLGSSPIPAKKLAAMIQWVSMLNPARGAALGARLSRTGGLRGR